MTNTTATTFTPQDIVTHRRTGKPYEVIAQYTDGRVRVRALNGVQDFRAYRTINGKELRRAS